MTATVAQLAARALRKTGLAPVAVASHPSAGSAVTLAVVAARALRLLGLNPVAAASQPSTGSTVTLALTAARALRLLGINPVAEADATANSGTTNVAAIATRALRKLGVVAADETPVSADTTIAEEKVTAVHEMLAASNLITWASSAVPVSVAEHYTIMAAHLIAPAFGMPQDIAAFDAAYANVRLIALSGAAGQALAEAEVTAAHQTANALGMVTWAISAIPEAAATHYAVMAASRLAQAMGRPVSDGDYTAALNLLRQFAFSGTAGQTLAEAEVTAAHQTLNGLGYVTWTTSAIPEAAATHYATMAASRLAPALGKPADDAGYSSAISLIRQFVMAGATGQAMAEEKVRGVHSDLDARGLTRWTLNDIPDYIEEPYVMIAAARLAPEVGQPSLPGMSLEGERMIRRLIALSSSGTPVQAVYF